jgi:hypothetical protein
LGIPVAVTPQWTKFNEDPAGRVTRLLEEAQHVRMHLNGQWVSTYPLIWTRKATSMKDPHFDTRQYPHIVCANSQELYKQLKARIGALIGQDPNKRG